MSLLDKASLVQIPSGYGDGKLYSVVPDNGDGDFTFARSSSATRVNSEGLIEEMSANVPRLDYSGGASCASLLLEPQRTNLVTYSEDYTDASWNKVNSAGSTLPIVTTDYGVSPDGTQNADRIQVSRASGAADFSSIYKSITTSSVNRALSVWLKSLNGTPTILIANNNGVYVSQQITTEWVRYELDLGVGTYTELQLSVVGSNFVQGVSESADFLAWGSQLEANSSYPTSYIPTSGSTVTRTADVCNNAGTSATFNSTEGVLFVEIAALADDLTSRVISLNDGSTSNRVIILYQTITSTIRVIVSSGGSIKFDSSTQNYDITNFNKIALKYKENDFALWINGTEVSTDTSGSTPIGLNNLELNNANGTSNFYGKCKQLIYFNEALTDEELTTLTTI